MKPQVVVLVVVSVGWLGQRSAIADVSTKSDEATRLFERARVLIDAGRYVEACPLFEESQALDGHSGTIANLAYCYENIGKTASAWKWWLEAAVSYSAQGRLDEAQVARGRAALLEPHLGRMAVSVESAELAPSLDVRVDGQALPKNLWNTAAPFDPGSHLVEAQAPGRQPWSATVDVSVEHTTEVTVPALQELARSSWQKKAALAVGAGGIAAVAVGLGFGGAVISAHSQIGPFCSSVKPTNCDGRADGLKSQMDRDGLIATAAVGIGAGALVGAAILWFWPHGAPAAVRGITYSPSIARDGAALSIGEAW